MKELIDLYSVDREFTGMTAVRGDVLPDDMYCLVVHVCIFNSNGEMLIQKRSKEKERWPGMWDLSVCGCVRAGETSRDAGVREAKEELGLDIDFDTHRPILTINFEKGFDDFYTIEADIDISELDLQQNEVDEVKWADCETVEEMVGDGSFFPLDGDLLRYLFSAREGHGIWNL